VIYLPMSDTELAALASEIATAEQLGQVEAERAARARQAELAAYQARWDADAAALRTLALIARAPAVATA
jgi:hypothetical protein